MLQARTLAEAHLYLTLRGLELLEVQQHPEGLAFCCVTDALGSEETVVLRILAEQGDPLFGGPEPSTLLEPADFAAWAAAVDRMVPPSPRGLVRAAVWAAHQELVVGLEALEEAQRRAPSAELDALHDSLSQRLDVYALALPEAPGNRPLAEFVDEPPGLVQGLEARVGQAGSLSLPALLDGALGPFSLVGAAQGRLLLRHPRGPVLWATVRAGRVEALELVTGAEAVEAWQTWGMELSAPAAVRVREAMVPGREVGAALGAAFPEPDLVQPLARVPGETEHLYFYLAQTADPLRAVVLAVRGDLEGRLVGHLVLQDQAAAEQYARLMEAVGPDPAGDAAQRAILLARHVAEQAKAVIWTLLLPEGPQTVRPRPQDYARVFPALGEAVAEVYEGLWSRQQPGLEIQPTCTELVAWACPAGLMDEPGPLGADMPDALVEIHRHLAPDLAWVSWRWQDPDSGEGRAFHGLVWVDDHWAWFPKPWAVLRRLGA